MQKTYLEYRDEKSSKFWEIELEGASHTVRYGKIGTDGRAQTKEFDSVDEAKTSAEKLIASKRKKGYQEAAQEAAELTLDMDAVRAAAEELGTDDELSEILADDYSGFDELVEDLGLLGGEPEATDALTRALAKALGAPRTLKLEGDQEFEEPFFHHGDLVIGGALTMEAGFLVTGDLRVGMTITDCGPDSFVVIGGDVHTAGIFTDGEFYVAGDVHAAQFVYGSYNDNVFAASTVHAPLLIEDDHSFWCDFEVEHHHELGEYDAADPQFQELLVDACFDDDEVSAEKLVEVVNEGQSIFRSKSESDKTYLEYQDEKSSKFWEIELDGASHTVRYGAIGTDGRTLTKEFDSADEAEKSAQKLIASKRNKGYEDA